MRVSRPTNHNYYEECPIYEGQLKDVFCVRSTKDVKKIFSTTFELTTKSDSLEQIKIFGFKKQRNKLDNEEQLILKLYSKESSLDNKKYIIQTGLFAGVLYHKGCQVNITTPYGDAFLKRMLNFVNDIYLDNQEAKSSKNEQVNEFQNIIAYLFIQSLEKAAVLGLPKTYQQSKQRSHKVRGKVDINAYLKHDFPFQGKLSTTCREQVYVQEIIDVLFLACKKLEKTFGIEIHRKILGIYQILKQSYSGSYSIQATIEKAKNHSVLQNPMYSAFKNVLAYAEIILKEQDLLDQSQYNKYITHGYLFDISQLFEVYLEKLISRHFIDWKVNGQEELNVYDDMFYGRKMFPDLVLRHKETNQIAVFDAKFKRMSMRKMDLDRSDFYQMHSYIQYYQPNIFLGGLIYPLSKPLVSTNSHSNSLFGKVLHQPKFIIDGIQVNEEMSMHDIVENENLFLQRIGELLNGGYSNK